MKDEIMNIFRTHKLANCLFRSEFTLKKSEITENRLTEDALENISKRQSVEKLSSHILSNVHSSIVRIETHDSIKYETELLVLKHEDFKTIVEAAIQLMPQSVIDEIKSGKNI